MDATEKKCCQGIMRAVSPQDKSTRPRHLRPPIYSRYGLYADKGGTDAGHDLQKLVNQEGRHAGADASRECIFCEVPGPRRLIRRAKSITTRPAPSR